MIIIITPFFRRRLIVSHVTVEVEAVVVVVAVETVEVVDVVDVVVAVEALEVVEAVDVVEAVAKLLYRSHAGRCLQERNYKNI